MSGGKEGVGLFNNINVRVCFILLQMTGKAAVLQQKLEKKQADCLQKIKEKESQVKAGITPGFCDYSVHYILALTRTWAIL